MADGDGSKRTRMSNAESTETESDATIDTNSDSRCIGLQVIACPLFRVVYIILVIDKLGVKCRMDCMLHLFTGLSIRTLVSVL